MGKGMHQLRGMKEALDLVARITRQHTLGPTERAFDADERLDAQIHLEHGEATRDAVPQLLTHRLARRLVGCIAVHANAVAERAAGEHIGGHAIGFARQVHQRHLDGADTAALPPVVAELRDLAEDLVHVAGILAEDAALEHECVRLAGVVADLAVAAEPLIGVDADEGEAPSIPAHGRGP